MISVRKPALPRQASAGRRRRPDALNALLWFVVALTLAFLLAPLLILVLTSLSPSTVVEFPPSGLSLVWYERLIDTLLGAPGTRMGLTASLLFSLQLGILVAVLAVACGVPAALMLHKRTFRGKQLLYYLFLLPLLVPQLAIGVALLLMFSDLRLFSGDLRFIRLLVGHLIITLPFVILTVEASLRVYEEEVESAARSLGANAWQTFWFITMPLIRPGVIAGAVFAFINSFTAFTISFFLSFGVHPLPVWLFNVISRGYDPLITAISVSQVVMTIIMVLTLEYLIGVRRLVAR